MEKSNSKLTYFQAFKAMFMFLQEFYDRAEEPGDLGLLLGELHLLKDNSPADPATWYDWVNMIEKVLKEEQIDTGDL